MNNITRVLCLLLTFVTLPSIATWEQGSFASGSIKHNFANSGPNRQGAEFEIFCGIHDFRLSGALYLPSHKFLNRENIKVRLRVDKQPLWTFTATRHAMAIVIPDTPAQLLSQLSKGNRAILTFPVTKDKSQTEQFILQNSARTLTSLQSICNSQS